MKDILYAILFFVIFIVFGVLINFNQSILNKIEFMEKQIIKNNTAIKTNTAGDLLFSNIMGKVIERIEKIERNKGIVVMK